MTDAGIAVVAAVLFGALAASLVSAEIALSRTARMGPQGLVQGEGTGPRRLEAVAADVTRHLNVILLARIACEVIALLALAVGVVVLLGPGWLSVALAAIVMVVVDYVLIGVTPRILGRQFADRIALLTARVVLPAAVLLSPLAQGLVRVGRALTPPGKGDREGPFTGEEELRRLVDLAERGEVIDADERQMIQSVFKLDDTSVREVMIPRTDIVFVDADAQVDEALSLALRSGYSRIPVTGQDEDDVVGIVYLKDLVSNLRGHGADTPVGDTDAQRASAAPARLTVRDEMRTASYVPDSKPIDELLREMQRRRSHVAVVIDEYGGTAGLVTIEDIVEEIVGEITDEYDDEVPPVQWLAEQNARVIARLSLGELAELFGVELDASDVETVGGLLAYALGRVPTTGSQAVYAGLRLTAENGAASPSQTTTVLVEKVAGADDEDTDTAEDS